MHPLDIQNHCCLKSMKYRKPSSRYCFRSSMNPSFDRSDSFECGKEGLGQREKRGMIESKQITRL